MKDRLINAVPQNKKYLAHTRAVLVLFVLSEEKGKAFTALLLGILVLSLALLFALLLPSGSFPADETMTCYSSAKLQYYLGILKFKDTQASLF